MKSNNIIQHLLIHLLNPGMYNEKILRATLAEITAENASQFLAQRFMFQKLKPAVLPIQSEWVDKEFQDYFYNYAKNNTLELSNGTNYKINIINLCEIVKNFKNSVAVEVASKIEQCFKAYISAEHKYILMENKNCDFLLSIEALNVVDKNARPRNISDFDFILYRILTKNVNYKNEKELVRDIKKIKNTMKPKEIEQLLNFYLFHYRARKPEFSELYNAMALLLIKEKKFQEAFFANSVSVYERNWFFTSIEKEFSEREKILLVKNSNIRKELVKSQEKLSIDIKSFNKEIKGPQGVELFKVKDKKSYELTDIENYLKAIIEHKIDTRENMTQYYKPIHVFLSNSPSLLDIESIFEIMKTIKPSHRQKKYTTPFMKTFLQNGYIFQKEDLKFLTKELVVLNDKNILNEKIQGAPKSKNVLKI